MVVGKIEISRSATPYPVVLVGRCQDHDKANRLMRKTSLAR
jgi:hypothetical protein